jgi:tRNA-Thr(GGU) m(6)t(6)A37 methyltransferase TsaA
MVEIGTVHSPYRKMEDVPCCAIDRLSEVAVVEVDHDYSDGLSDLQGFSHVMIIVHLHKALEEKLVVTPRIDDTKRGVYATRSPLRPNHLGVSIVELIKVEGRNLLVRGIDLLDGTPVLDIKPYIPYDARSPLRLGWLEGKIAGTYPPDDPDGQS